MHPGRCAQVVLDGKVIGHVGELHPKWRQAYELAPAPVMFELELDAVLQRPVPEFKPVAKHQPVQRDIAVVVAEERDPCCADGRHLGRAHSGLAARCPAVRCLPPQAGQGRGGCRRCNRPKAWPFA